MTDEPTETHRCDNCERPVEVSRNWVGLGCAKHVATTRPSATRPHAAANIGETKTQ